MIVSHQLCNAKHFKINSKISDLEHVKLKNFLYFQHFNYFVIAYKCLRKLMAAGVNRHLCLFRTQ
jgi:hypothetical protein